MRTKIAIGESDSHESDHGSVTVTCDTLEIDLDPQAIAEAQAKAAAVAVSRGIRAIPSAHGHQPFNVSGKLATGIAVQRNPDGSASVVAPPDRLTRDPALVEKLVEKVPELQRPADAPEVRKALEKSASEIVTTRRG